MPLSPDESSVETSCKNYAYTRLVLEDYITTRFHSQAPVRVGIIPFSVPANLSAYNNERPGLGNMLSWHLHQKLMRREAAPIVEVLNRHDWPGKKEEFFTGNFGALQTARDAGYDLVLVGYLEPARSTRELSVFSKLIEVESGTTVWYGRSVAQADTSFWHDSVVYLGLESKEPSRVLFRPLLEELTRCVASGILAHTPVPLS